MKDLLIVAVIIALIYIFFFKGCSFDDTSTDTDVQTPTIDYSQYVYETAFEFKYEHSPNSKNRNCYIYIDGLEAGKIDDGEVRTKMMLLEGGQHDIYVEAISLFSKGSSSKTYFEVNDDNNTFKFVIKDESFWGLTMSCDESSYSSQLGRKAKQ